MKWLFHHYHRLHFHSRCLKRFIRKHFEFIYDKNFQTTLMGLLILAAMVVIFFFSVIREFIFTIGGPVTNSGTYAHMLAYFGLTLLIIIYMRIRHRHLGKNYLLRAVYFSAGYGILMEFIQYFSPYRTLELYDVIINLIGALIAITLYVLVSRDFKR